MLLHIRPRLYSPFRDVSLIDLEIEPFGMRLVGGEDLKTGRPYPNKCYAVACRKKGHKAFDGILIESEAFIKKFRCTARWAIEADSVVTHRVDYKILDRKFDAASDSMMFWHACCAELGGWSNRFPPGAERSIPLVSQPMMEVVPESADRRRASQDVVEGEWIVSRRECFAMPTIERGRILQSRLGDRIPSGDMAIPAR
jgi:hypothetical protein